MKRDMDNWDKIRVRQNESGLAELYHENTKRSKFSSKPMSNTDLLAWARNIHHCIPLSYEADVNLELLDQPLYFVQIIRNSFKNLNLHICPIELYLHIPIKESGLMGLYHYDKKQNLRLLKQQTCSELEQYLPSIILTCTFEKVVVPYGDRGYRRALINCGQVIQNMNQTPEASLFIDENYSDYEVEEYLNIDGVNHSILEVLLIGNKKHKHGSTH